MATFTPFNHYRSFLPQDALAHFIVAANWRHLQDICAVGLMKLAVLPRATLGHIGHPLRAFGLVRAAYGPMLLRSRADGSPD